jgi:hypothetical protein
LVLYATKTSLPFIPVIFTISKSDGSIVRAFEINDSQIGLVNPPSKQEYRNSFMSATSPTGVYLAVNKPDKTSRGLIKFTDLSSSCDIEWHII